MRKIILILGVIALMVLLSGCAQKKPVQQSIVGTNDLSASNNLPQSRELSQQEIDSGNFRELEVKISGMSCPYCASGVSTALLSDEGIIKTDITLEKKGGTIIYDATKTTKENIVDSTIFEAVYKASIVDDRAIN